MSSGISIEIGGRTFNLDLNASSEERRLSLNELVEVRREAYDNTWVSKATTKIFHDKKINRKVFFSSQKSSCTTLGFIFSKENIGLGGKTLILWFKCSLIG